ncbi:MAG: hypothetical protein EOO12_06700 [Chitinophagaceae bacterium]|nr:MAG: hypothetical protein EOO12_06700 [Chitinophagaceae bacterium]
MLTIFWNQVSCQDKLTPGLLTRVFKESIDQPEKDVIIFGQNAWQFCNSDSAYFKSDTLYMYAGAFEFDNHAAAQFTCCERVGWTFYKAGKIVVNRCHLCREPSQCSFTTRSDHYQVKVRKQKLKLFIDIVNSAGTQSFQVINLYTDRAGRLFRIITLLRVRKAD